MNTSTKQQKSSNGVKNTIKKVGEFIASRMFYLLIGLFLAITISAVYAAVTYPLPNVGSGDTLTSAAWNDVVDDINDLNSRTGNWPAGSYCIFRNGGTCPAGFVDDTINIDIGTHVHDQCPGDEVAGDSTFAGAGFCSIRVRMCCK